MNAPWPMSRPRRGTDRDSIGSMTESLRTSWLRSRGRSALHHLGRGRAIHPTDTTSFPPDAPPGPVTQLFEAIRDIPGWFTIDDCAHFSLILALQTLGGVSGNILEIGSYHGRSTCLMARYLGEGEKLVVIDAFEQPTADPYSDRPSPERLLANIVSVNPGLSPSRVDLLKGYSDAVELDPARSFRFCHIDGGHSQEAAAFDLHLCSSRTIVGGVIVIDDYRHPRFPGVSAAADEFIGANASFKVLADLNRHGAKGRKLYIYRCYNH